MMLEASPRPSPLRTGVANMAKGKYTRTAAHIESLTKARAVYTAGIGKSNR